MAIIVQLGLSFPITETIIGGQTRNEKLCWFMEEKSIGGDSGNVICNS